MRTAEASELASITLRGGPAAAGRPADCGAPPACCIVTSAAVRQQLGGSLAAQGMLPCVQPHSLAAFRVAPCAAVVSGCLLGKADQRIRRKGLTDTEPPWAPGKCLAPTLMLEIGQVGASADEPYVRLPYCVQTHVLSRVPAGARQGLPLDSQSCTVQQSVEACHGLTRAGCVRTQAVAQKAWYRELQRLTTEEQAHNKLARSLVKALQAGKVRHAHQHMSSAAQVSHSCAGAALSTLSAPATRLRLAVLAVAMPFCPGWQGEAGQIAVALHPLLGLGAEVDLCACAQGFRKHPQVHARAAEAGVGEREACVQLIMELSNESRLLADHLASNGQHNNLQFLRPVRPASAVSAWRWPGRPWWPGQQAKSGPGLECNSERSLSSPSRKIQPLGSTSVLYKQCVMSMGPAQG